MNRNKFLIFCIILFAFSVFFTIRTYAAFRTTVAATGKLRTAAWSFKANGTPSSFSTDLGELFPGASGNFEVRLSAAGSDVPVEYIITFENPVNIPENLHFYQDEDKQIEIDLDGGTMAGSLPKGTERIITVFYNWPSGNEAEAVNDGLVSFDMTIVGYQENPEEGV